MREALQQTVDTPAWLSRQDADGEVLRKLHQEHKLDGVSTLFLSTCQVVPEMRRRKSRAIKDAHGIDAAHPPQATFQEKDYEPTGSVRFLVSDAVFSSGGMGEVRRGWDLNLGKPVLTKILTKDPNSKDYQMYKEMFEREAKTMAHLDHPALPRVYEYTGVGKPMYFMDNLREHEYKGLHSKVGKMGRVQLLTAVRDICELIDYCAARGVYHYDLKPANILVNEQGSAKVIDFGISSWAMAGVEPFGTPTYMSPERVKEEKNAQPLTSEIYSLGSVFYEMLTGERFFADHDAQGAVRSELDIAAHVATSSGMDELMRQKVRQAANLRGFDGEKIIELLDRCHRQDPTKRFQSGKELLEAIAEAVVIGPEIDPDERIQVSITASPVQPQQTRVQTPSSTLWPPPDPNETRIPETRVDPPSSVRDIVQRIRRWWNS